MIGASKPAGTLLGFIELDQKFAPGFLGH